VNAIAHEPVETPELKGLAPTGRAGATGRRRIESADGTHRRACRNRSSSIVPCLRPEQFHDGLADIRRRRRRADLVLGPNFTFLGPVAVPGHSTGINASSAVWALPSSGASALAPLPYRSMLHSPSLLGHSAAASDCARNIGLPRSYDKWPSRTARNWPITAGHIEHTLAS
jgi:hypothetical protein